MTTAADFTTTTITGDDDMTTNDAQDITYNGWTNRETWAASLWLNNDEGAYRLAMEAVGRWDSRDETAAELTSILDAYMTDDVDLTRVNWAEVIDGLTEGA